jgi:GNAT superfamily N-acetyltransferase
VERVPSDAVTIESLVDRPDLILPVARIRWNEWGGESGREELQWWVDTTREESGRVGLPVTFVATDADGEAVGAVGLIPVDYDELADRGPWVVGTIVRADRRDRGIGTALLARLRGWAADAGFDRVWVTTGGPAVDFYRGCGFTVTDVARLANEDRFTVLSAPLPALGDHGP